MRIFVVGVEVPRCQFYFAQSIQRKIGKLSFKTAYDARTRFYNNICMYSFACFCWFCLIVLQIFINYV